MSDMLSYFLGVLFSDFETQIEGYPGSAVSAFWRGWIDYEMCTSSSFFVYFSSFSILALFSASDLSYSF